MRKFFGFLVMLVVMTAASVSVKAQYDNPLRMGIGINGGSTLKGDRQAVLGVDARLQAPFGNGLSGIVTTGYYHFFKNAESDNNFGIIPVKLGLKFFPVRNVYIAGEVGVGIGTKENQETSLVYSPSIGLAFGNGLDISVKYEDYTKYEGYVSQLALRLAYGFTL